MDILIKRNDYENFMEFLIKNQDEGEWKIFLETIRTNSTFLKYIKDYLVGLTSITTLRKFLYKILSLKGSDTSMTQQIIQLEIIDHIRLSNSPFNNNTLVKNLYLIQTLRLAILDHNYKERLVDIIKSDMKLDTWFINLLESFTFYEELACLYEVLGDYKTALKYYKMSQNNSKVDELNEKLLTPVISDEDSDAVTELSINN
jgi:hypothetical protein